LAASYFVLSLNPFLLHMKEQLGCTVVTKFSPSPAAVLRACADDIGVALSSWRLLLRLEVSFALVARLANLKLKVVKCVLIPVAQENFERLSSRLSDWLARFLPQWSVFQIVLAAKYLGFSSVQVLLVALGLLRFPNGWGGASLWRDGVRRFCSLPLSTIRGLRQRFRMLLSSCLRRLRL